MTPLKRNIIIRRAKPDEKIGSIYIPDKKHADKTDTGVVLAVGPDAYDVKEGDVVVFNKYIGDEFEREGQKVLLYPCDKLFAVLS